MGYETERFVSPIDEEFLCSICLCVFEDPVHGPCGHAFCTKCIDSWIPLNVNTCPLDKKPLMRKDLMPVCLPLRNLLNRLELKCDFESVGCTFTCPLGIIQDHVNMCIHNPEGDMICESGCGLKFKRKNLDLHKCIDALKDLVKSKDQELAELKRNRATKRPYDSMRLSEISEQRLMNQFRATETMRRRLGDALATRDRYREGLVETSRLDRPGPSISQSIDSPPVLQRESPQPSSESELRSVRVMLRRLTDEDIQARHQVISARETRREPPTLSRFRAINSDPAEDFNIRIDTL